MINQNMHQYCREQLILFWILQNNYGFLFILILPKQTKQKCISVNQMKVRDSNKLLVNSQVTEVVKKAEEELRHISMTEDFDERFSPERKNKKQCEIEPWKDEQQNPSVSPERRNYMSRCSGSVDRPQKILTPFKIGRVSAKAQEFNDSPDFSLKLRTTQSKLTPTTPVHKKEFVDFSNMKGDRSRRTSIKFTNSRMEKDDLDSNSCRTLSMIVYPMMKQGGKRRLFRKMDKFQAFVSVSLRK